MYVVVSIALLSSLLLLGSFLSFSVASWEEVPRLLISHGGRGHRGPRKPVSSLHVGKVGKVVKLVRRSDSGHWIAGVEELLQSMPTKCFVVALADVCL